MTQLTVSQDVVRVLAPLVGGRCYQRTFVQPGPGETLPAWPAVRFVFVSVEPGETICGDGGDDAADYLLQIDLVDAQAKGEAAFHALRAQVLAAMRALGSSVVWSAQRDDFDAETKTLRCSLDYRVHQSA